MFPIIPLLAVFAMIGGGGTLYWYHGLSAEQKQEADAFAGSYAWAVFKKTLSELSKDEAKHVYDYTKQHYGY